MSLSHGLFKIKIWRNSLPWNIPSCRICCAFGVGNPQIPWVCKWDKWRRSCATKWRKFKIDGCSLPKWPLITKRTRLYVTQQFCRSPNECSVKPQSAPVKTDTNSIFRFVEKEYVVLGAYGSKNSITQACPTWILVWKRAIITRSWFKTALDYKPRILLKNFLV